MPRHWKTTKDVAACEKPRGGGKQPLIRGSPNGETQSCVAGLSHAEYISMGGKLGELKHLITRRKRKNCSTYVEHIPKVVASEMGTAQTLAVVCRLNVILG